MKKKETKRKTTIPKNKQKIDAVYNPEMSSVIKIAIIVLVVLAVVYLFTAIVTGKIKFGGNSSEENETEIQYEEILVGESFHQNATEYLVLFYDSTKTDAGLYTTLLNSYKLKSGALEYYRVDLANPLNQMYVTDEGSNLWVQKPADLRFHDAALLKFSNKAVAEVYEGKAAISEYFNGFGK